MPKNAARPKASRFHDPRTALRNAYPIARTWRARVEESECPVNSRPDCNLWTIRSEKLNVNQLLGHVRLLLSRVAHERPGLRKSRVTRRVTGKMRVQIAFIRRRFLLASKFPYKRCDVPLNSHSVIGLSRILLLTF